MRAAALPLAALVACAHTAGPTAPSAPAAESATPTAHDSMFSSADAYERYMGRWSRKVAPELVRFADVQDGERVLDVGSGTGALAFAILAVTKTAEVVGIDTSEEYVRYAVAHAPDGRAMFHVGDAQAMSLPDASFDRTVSLLVMNFIPDPPKALAEMARVTKPGGVVAAAVWDYAEGMEMLRVFWEEAIALDPAAADRRGKHMVLAKPGELTALWQAGGLVDVSEAPLAIPMHFNSFDDYWKPFTLGQGTVGSYLIGLPRDQQDALQARLRARLVGDRPDTGFDLAARVWAVKGRVAPRP
jgi:SAM-dependent methyltransferase